MLFFQPDSQFLSDTNDCVAKVSKTSSKAPSISSACIKAAADRAALLARAEALKRKLEFEKLQLSSKMESLEMEGDIAGIDAKIKTLEEIENNMEKIPKSFSKGYVTGSYQDEREWRKRPYHNRILLD